MINNTSKIKRMDYISNPIPCFNRKTVSKTHAPVFGLILDRRNLLFGDMDIKEKPSTREGFVY